MVMWDESWRQAFKRDHCVQVWCQTKKGKKKHWRRRDRDPLEGEQHEVTEREPSKRERGTDAMRDTVGMAKTGVDPASKEARRTRFEETLKGIADKDNPNEVAPTDVIRAIEAADTMMQLGDKRLTSAVGEMGEVDRESMRAHWKTRAGEIKMEQEDQS